MKFHFKFSNLLGTVYRKGNLVFSPDGNNVMSCVGNKLSIFDLKRNVSETLPIEARSNFSRLALSTNGILLLASTDEGEIHLISLISRSILHTLRTNRNIADIAFSPDGKKFAIAKETNVFVYQTPGVHSQESNPFVMLRVLKGAYDDTSCIQWSSCSRILAVGAKDTSTRLYALEDFENFKTITIGGSNEAIVGAFFEANSLDCYTVSANGQIAIWDCSLSLEELKQKDPTKDGQALTDKKIKMSKKKKKKDNEEDDSESEDEVVDKENEAQLTLDCETETKFFYKRKKRFFAKDELPKEERKCDLAAVDYHQRSHIMVLGFTNGSFFIYEMPECNVIHSLSISNQSISSITINPSGDWIALGSATEGQLLVWEWQSESFVMKQQGHFNNMACLAYSPDGQNVATGGEDGKVKVWSTTSGFSFVTFSEHTAPVTSVIFAPNGKVVLSASLDGSIRAFDMARYRNFRTFTAPRPAQFGCLALDSSGELIAAGGRDVYEIYLWSMKTGRLLEVLSGHEGPVSAVQFSPNPSSSMLASVSWDKTLKIWNSLSSNSASETIQLLSDGTAVAFRPDGLEVAVATLNGKISFFNVRTSNQSGTIEGRKDLGSGRADADLITAKRSLEGKGFLSLCYSADGAYILAGGQSKHVCIYHVQEKLLIKKFEVTQNRSFDAMDEVISRKKMTEFGMLVEGSDDPLGSQTIALPGTKKGDMSSRALRPEVQVSSLGFSPTGRDFAATTTEGLLIYSIDSKTVFDPIDLDLEITPASIRSHIRSGYHAKALLMSLKLNEVGVIREALESIRPADITLSCDDIPDTYVVKLLSFIGSEMEQTRHIHFYALWARNLLERHGSWLKKKCQEFMPTMNQLHKTLRKKSHDLGSVCEHNIHTMRFLLTMSQLKTATTKDITEDAMTNGGSDGEAESDQDLFGASEAFASHWDIDSDSAE